MMSLIPPPSITHPSLFLWMITALCVDVCSNPTHECHHNVPSIALLLTPPYQMWQLVTGVCLVDGNRICQIIENEQKQTHRLPPRRVLSRKKWHTYLVGWGSARTGATDGVGVKMFIFLKKLKHYISRSILWVQAKFFIGYEVDWKYWHVNLHWLANET